VPAWQPTGGGPTRPPRPAPPDDQPAAARPRRGRRVLHRAGRPRRPAVGAAERARQGGRWWARGRPGEARKPGRTKMPFRLVGSNSASAC